MEIVVQIFQVLFYCAGIFGVYRATSEYKEWKRRDDRTRLIDTAEDVAGRLACLVTEYSIFESRILEGLRMYRRDLLREREDLGDQCCATEPLSMFDADRYIGVSTKRFGESLGDFVVLANRYQTIADAQHPEHYDDWVHEVTNLGPRIMRVAHRLRERVEADLIVTQGQDVDVLVRAFPDETARAPGTLKAAIEEAFGPDLGPPTFAGELVYNRTMAGVGAIVSEEMLEILSRLRES